MSSKVIWAIKIISRCLATSFHRWFIAWIASGIDNYAHGGKNMVTATFLTPTFNATDEYICITAIAIHVFPNQDNQIDSILVQIFLVFIPFHGKALLWFLFSNYFSRSSSSNKEYVWWYSLIKRNIRKSKYTRTLMRAIIRLIKYYKLTIRIDWFCHESF